MLRIEEVEDVDEVYVVTNDKFYPHFKEWADKYSSNKDIIIVNDGTKTNEDRLGAVGDIHYVIHNKEVDDDVLVIAGDNLFEFSLHHLAEFFKRKGSSVFAVHDLRDPEKLAGRFGVVETDEEAKIVGFEEKPERPRTSLASTGCYIFSKDDVEEFERCIHENNKPDNIGDFVRFLSEKKHVYGYVFEENWFDIGSHEQLSEVRDLYGGKE